MSARQREPAGDGDTRVRFFLGAIAPPQAAEGAQFCKLPPETRACRKAAARGVQGKNQRRLRCAVKVKLIKLEGGTAAGMIGRWKQKRKAPARGRFTANAAYPFIRTNALRAYPQGVCCCLGWMMRTDRRLLLRAGQQGQQQGHLFGHGGLRVGDQRGQAVVLKIGQEQIRFVFAHG